MNFRDPVDERTPIDYLEPLEGNSEYRECALGFLRIISLAMSRTLEADDPRVAALGVCYALGLISVVGSKTMRETARELSVSHGTISYHARQFALSAGLPPSVLCKEEEQIQKSREARHRYVARGEAALTTEKELE